MKEFKKLREAGVPLAVISTADPMATMRACIKTLGKKDEQPPVAVWDIVRGLVGVNDQGGEMCGDISPDGPIQSGNPTECLSLLYRLDKKYNDAIIFFSNADKFIENEGVLQGVWNLRDMFASKHCTLILLCPSITLPPALKQDIIVIDEPLPDAEELEAIAKSVVEDAEIGIDKLNGDLPAVVDTMRGLSAFAAGQCLAMSITKQGIDLKALMKLKRSYISQLPGVEVREDKIAFNDIAGYDNVKIMLRRKIEGKRPPRLVLWLDELEKAFAGSVGDLSGTTQDQVGTILTWMQDRLNEDRLSAMMLVGFPGTGKSAISMAVKNEANCECLRLDMGGMKDSLVGGSEKRIRAVLKTVDAMSGGHILVVATCNSVKNLPSPLMSRFAFGTYFFDLPTREEGDVLWKLKRKKYAIESNEANPPSEGWTGREVQQCCFLANDLNIPLSEAAKYITPFCATGIQEMESLRAQANNRFLSASTPGFYKSKAATTQEQAPTGRRMALA